MNDKLGRKPKKSNGIEFIINEFDNKIDNVQLIANKMNDFIREIGSKSNNKIRVPKDIPKIPFNDKSIFIRQTKSIGITNIIAQIKGKAGGVDGIRMKMLKILSHHIIEPLSLIINLCIGKTTWPDALKTSEVIPIHKNGAKHTPNN